MHVRHSTALPFRERIHRSVMELAIDVLTSGLPDEQSRDRGGQDEGGADREGRPVRRERVDARSAGHDPGPTRIEHCSERSLRERRAQKTSQVHDGRR